jgi:hypothetical protein
MTSLVLELVMDWAIAHTQLVRDPCSFGAWEDAWWAAWDTRHMCQAAMATRRDMATRANHDKCEDAYEAWFDISVRQREWCEWHLV